MSASQTSSPTNINSKELPPTHSRRASLLSQNRLFNLASPQLVSRPRMFSDCADDYIDGTHFNGLYSHRNSYGTPTAQHAVSPTARAVTPPHTLLPHHHKTSSDSSGGSVTVDIDALNTSSSTDDMDNSTEHTPLNSTKHAHDSTYTHPKPTEGPFAPGHSRRNTGVPVQLLSPNTRDKTQHKRLTSRFLDIFTPVTRQRSLDSNYNTSPLNNITNLRSARESGADVQWKPSPRSLDSARATQNSTPAFLTRDTDELCLNDISNASRAHREKKLHQMNNKLPQIGEVINPFNAEETQEFLRQLAAALFSSALPMNVVEFYVVLAANRLGADVHLMSVSNSMFIRFGTDTVAHLVQPPYVSYSLSKMVDLCHITERILTGAVGVREGLYQITMVVQRTPQWHPWSIVPALALMGCASALFWNGGGAEMLCALTSGLLIGVLECVAPLNLMLTRGHDLLSGLIASVVAVSVNAYITPVYIISSVFAGILWCLPGLRATLAMNDLSTGNTVTGTAKLVSSILTCIQLGIGVEAGLQLNTLCGSTPLYWTNDTDVVQPVWKLEIVVLINGLLTIVLMDGKSSHLIQLCAGSVTAFTLATYTSTYIGSEFGTWLAAFVTGLIGNVYGRLTSNPAIEYWLFSILMLVPGSIGVKSVLATDEMTTLSLFTTMLGISVAIVTGLFSANFALRPRRMM